MRKIFTIASALLLSATVNAQVVSTFDSLTLSGTDTFYVNYSKPATNVGFTSGAAVFETVYDTAGYSGLRRGFVYSNMTDSVTSGFTNQNSAKAGIGYNGSSQYAVAFVTDSVVVGMKDTAASASTQPQGFYITNNTYAYNSMKDGDGFAKKFGGVPNVDSDWFKVTVNAYYMGNLKTDYVEFYLADFRDPDSTKDYIMKTWEWVDLTPLGEVDSLKFSLSSSDTGSWGMNTPAYFCMDDMKINVAYVSVNDIVKAPAAKVYPNPAVNQLYVEVLDAAIQQVSIYDMTGKVVAMQEAKQSKLSFNVAQLPAGNYIIRMSGDNGVAVSKFVKQ